MVQQLPDQKFRSHLKAKVIDREDLNPEAAAVISRLSSKLKPAVRIR